MTTQALPITDPQLLEPQAPPKLIKTRLLSLDIFRGLTIAGMLLVNDPGPGQSYRPLDHIDAGSGWFGWTPTDLVFPFFLFIVGVAIPFSMAKRLSDPMQTRGGLLKHIWLRAVADHARRTRSLDAAGMARSAGWIYHAENPARLLLLFCVRRHSHIADSVAMAARFRLAPPIIAVVFMILIVSIFYANKHALANGLPTKLISGGIYRPDRFRIPGVLQRIGICYGVAATIALYFGWRMILFSAVAPMALYSVLMLACPFPGHVTGSITRQDNLSHSIDVAVFDRYTSDADGKKVLLQKHTYGPYADNEGLLSTIPAIATPLLGILAGIWLRTDKPGIEQCAALMAFGVPVTIIGCCLDSWLMPFCKDLWTPAFVCLTAGFAMMGLGMLFWLVDVKGWKKWSLPFVIFGMNSIAAYVAADVVPHLAELWPVKDFKTTDRVSFFDYLENATVYGFNNLSTWLQAHIHIGPITSPGMTSLVGGLVFVLVIWVLMALLYVCKIFVKV